MKKTIWIINQYASTPKVGMGGRHYYLSKELVKLGFNVYLIAGSYGHKMHSPPTVSGQYKLDCVEGINVVWIKVLKYLKSTSKRRIINWLIFSLKLLGLKWIIKDPPDYVLCSSPSLVSFLGAQQLSNHYEASLSFEVRDIWPLTLVKIGGFSVTNPLIRVLQAIEDYAYSESRFVFSNLERAYLHMESRGMDLAKFHWIPNGFCIEEVENPEPLPHSVRALIPEEGFVIGYAGSIGIANCLDVFIDAASAMRANNALKFLIVGEGAEKRRLIELAKARGLTNCIFIDRIPKEQIQSMLATFDCCYLGWKNDDLYQFGIGANKITDYLYAGKPVINSYSGTNDPFVKNRCGLNVPAESVSKLVEGINAVYKMSDKDRRSMGANGRQAALRHYEYSQLASRLALVLDSQRAG